MLIIIMTLIALLLIALGWGIEKKQWYFLISGYNTMSDQEQRQVNVRSLAKSIRRLLNVTALLLISLGIADYLKSAILTTAVIIILILFVIYNVFTTQKFYTPNTSSTTTGENPIKKSKIHKISLIITVVAGLFAICVVLFSLQPAKIDIENKMLSISGIYGDDLAFDEIQSVELLNTLPAISARTNGSSIGSIHKGHFKLTTKENVLLFVDRSIDSYVKVSTKEKIIIFNSTSKKQTEKLSEMLVDGISH